MAEYWGAAMGAATIAVLLGINRHLWGFLPYDHPGGRKRHHCSLPMVGVGLALLCVAALFWSRQYLVATGALVCFVVGYFDDRGKDREPSLPLMVKVAGLTVAAAIAASTPEGELGTQARVLAFCLAFVVINALNFLDNTNGVAVAVGGLGLLLATDGDGPFAFAGYLFLGFLPFNWPRPRALLGDAGALTLGYCLAVTALTRGIDGGSLYLTAALAPVAVPVLDFIQVVCARVYLGFAPWIADRRHLTHIAMYGGLPHVLVAPLFALLALGLFVVLR